MKLSELKAIQLAELFSALSDASRIRIIALLLESEMSVSALAKGLTMTESAVSHQLRTLRQLRLVRSRKEGRNVYYKLQDEHIEDLFLTTLKHIACE